MIVRKREIGKERYKERMAAVQHPFWRDQGGNVLKKAMQT